MSRADIATYLAAQLHDDTYSKISARDQLLVITVAILESQCATKFPRPSPARPPCVTAHSGAVTP